MSVENNSFEPVSFGEFHRRRSSEGPSVYGEEYRKPTTPASSTPKRRTSKVHFILNPGSGMLMSSSRQEFLPGEPNGGIKYERKGGVFVTRFGGCCICLAVLVLILLSCTLVYFFAPYRDSRERLVEDDLSWDIGKLHERTAGDTVRLVNSVKPSFYRLTIRPNLTTFTFDGTVAITLSTKKTTVKHISLHAKELQILNGYTLVEQTTMSFNAKMRRDLISNATAANSTNTRVTQSKTKQMKIISKELDKTIDRLVFALDSHLKPNTNYTLTINFTGIIDDSLTGFYKSSYVDSSDNTTRYLAVTQFEPISARKAFPCFDEPEFKATFEISIGCHKNFTVTSNMPLMTGNTEQDPNNSEILWWHFDRSLPMPPYLVAYAVTEFKPKEIVIPAGLVFKRETKFNIWARSEYASRTSFASEIAPKILNFFEKFFDMPYLMPKLDLFAIPDFSVGAMENWGMITFRETLLLIDEKNAAIRNKMAIAMIMAHELAHQWFGNLVTMRWWNDLWLNEGFATYMEYIGVNQVHPEWELMDRFSLEKQAALAVDSIENTHPVSAKVNDETQIAQIFDAISYKKAASLLRMLNHILTDTNFRNGLHKYMEIWKFNNADQNDLWEAFTTVVGDQNLLPDNTSVAALMNSWTLESGYPVIYVERHDENGTAVITQKRFFLYDASEKPKKKKKQLWYVPITYTYSNITSDKWTTTPKTWMKKEEKIVIDIPKDINGTWLYFNVNGIGHYRVNYDMNNWKKLEYGLFDEPRDFPPVTRAQLLDDAFNLARAGQLNYSVPLDLTKYMKDFETEYLPWVTALSNLQLLHLGMHKSMHFNLFLEYVSNLIMPALETIGFSPMSNDTWKSSLLRDNLIHWACLIEEPQCLDWVRVKFNSWMNQTDPDLVNPIPKNVRDTVYSTALIMGGRREFEFLFERFNNSNDPEVKSEILSTLPGTRTVWQLNALLEYSVTRMDIQFTPTFWGGFDTDLSIKMAFNFVMTNWDRIYAKYAKAEDQLLQYIINAAFSNIATEHDLRQFKRFIHSNRKDLSNVSKAVYRKVEEAVIRIQWAKTKMIDIENWLIRYSESVHSEFITLYDSNRVAGFQDDEDIGSLVFENPLDFAFYMG